MRASSEPFNMRLPERLFTKPLARALIEQRRILALDANQNAQVSAALDALMIAPELFMPQTGQYLGLYSVARQLEAAHTDDALREVVASLWALAVTIEDGNITDVDKALARGAGRAEAGAGTRRQRRGDQEAHRGSARGAGQFPAPACRTVAQQSAGTGAAARSQCQGHAPAGSQQHDRAHGAAVALRRQGCRQATARATAADAGKPADGAARPVRRRATWSRRSTNSAT